jgi:hypothetical protein
VEVLGLPQRPLLKAAASGIPIVEGGLAVWLLSGALAVGALAVTALLLALFTGILSVAVIRGYRGACACFGGNEERVGATAVAFDVCLVVLSLVALLVETGRTSPSSAITDLSWIEMIGIVIVGAALIGIRRLLGDVESIQHMLRSRE